MKLVIHDSLTLNKDHKPVLENINIVIKDNKIIEQTIVLTDKTETNERNMAKLLDWLLDNTEEFDLYKLVIINKDGEASIEYRHDFIPDLSM